MKIKLLILSLLITGILVLLGVKWLSSKAGAPAPDEIQIASVVFQHMFINAENWNIDAKTRSLKYLDYEVVPKFILDQLPSSNFALMTNGYNIVKRPNNEKPIQTLPQPTRFNGVLYSIDDLRIINGTEAIVKSHVEWHPLAARGYTYKLKKEDVRWVVIECEQTWLS